MLLREFAMLAGLSTVATSLDLLFISLFSLEQFASLTLAVFIALACYAAARQWMLDQMMGSRALTTERTFEQLYRIAREVQKQPERRPALMSQLLRDLFDPLEVMQVDKASPRARVLADGSALVVPVRGGGASSDEGGSPQTLVLRFAGRGRRIFTGEDARLTDRIVEQLRRAVAYDRAVERGRSEERQRIAQDLHDDIGARLLTLMYKAQDPEIEDYLRHTLQDLKTLTRGLAAANHWLSDSVGEWKADIQQRLTAAHIGLDWSFTFDDDLHLTVVQWSALTRVLRELVSNTIYHARATRVEIRAEVSGGALQLQVIDDGHGRNPAAWAHGLGLGGVRKRVKQLGGEVAWRERQPQGIVCEVRVPEWSRRA
jgi:signal transduction histidine kinase